MLLFLYAELAFFLAPTVQILKRDASELYVFAPLATIASFHNDAPREARLPDVLL